MDFAELLALLMEPGDDGVPDTIYDDLSLSYNDAVGSRDAKIGTQEAAYAELLADNQRLKALNFDLLMATKGDESESETETETPTDSDDDDIFETKED